MIIISDSKAHDKWPLLIYSMEEVLQSKRNLSFMTLFHKAGKAKAITKVDGRKIFRPLNKYLPLFLPIKQNQ